MNLIDRQIDQLAGGVTRDELARGMAGVVGDNGKGLAALLLGGPLQTVAGAATADLLERVALTRAIKGARAALPMARLQSGGNIAAARIEIPGLPTQMVASSRVDVAGNGPIGEGGGNFTFTSVPNARGTPISRDGDSEYKILDNVADILGGNTSASGTIKIVTERPACSSCLDVAQQFAAKYPNIEVKPFDNSGVLLTAAIPKKP